MKAFASDNYAPVHPEVIEQIIKVNSEHAKAYGADEVTEKAINLIRQTVGDPNCSVNFVFNGTGANVTGLQTIMDSWNAVICASTAHINVDEGGAPERLLGVKLIDIQTPNGKLTPDLISNIWIRTGDQHTSQPNVVSITQSTEMGTVYTPAEVKALADIAHKNNSYLHMDGARISNAAASLGVSIAELTSKAGVDIFSFGGTKNGLMGAEAVVFFKPELNKKYPWIRKSAMQLASKHRYLAAQFIALLTDDLWKKNADKANAMAQLLRSKIENNPKIKLTQETQSNAIFAILEPNHTLELQKKHNFYVWNDHTGEVRLMCSWDTTIEDVENFAKDINSICK
ncbi:MAG: low specificity L-threonine aldolase [Actinomycetota bacterium]|nr:low specificity L-threonine aldolase [Actinomycetota bacterium]